MSQTPNPHDPYGTEPGSPVPPQPNSGTSDPDAPQVPAPQGDVPLGDIPAPTSDPALHPHDPYAYEGGQGRPGPAAYEGGQGQPGPAGYEGGQGQPGAQVPPTSGQPDFGQGAESYAGPAGYAQGAPYGGHDARHLGAQSSTLSAPPAGVKGVYDGPLSGQPVSASDGKLWSMLAHLSSIAGYVLGAGFLGWLGPLIIFLVYKDRDRYIRYNAAEALNAAITVVIAYVVLGIGIGILGIITLSLGWLLFPVAWIPAFIHVIFAIIAAVKVNERSWWNYPINLRMVK